MRFKPGLYSEKLPKKLCSMCQMAMAEISVVLAVKFGFCELKVPLRKVAAGCEAGSFSAGIDTLEVRRSSEPLVGVS